MYNDKSNQEYLKRRKEDNRKTHIIESFTDNIYKENHLIMQRIYDTTLQKKGVDLIHTFNNEKRYIDEKFAINYFDKTLNTFAFELVSKNNFDKQGWFTSPNMITTHYCILWFNSDETLQNIYTYDLCYIDKNKLMKYLYSIGYYDEIVNDFIDFWNGYIKDDTEQYYKSGPRLYRNLGNGIKIVQSPQFKIEQPINIVIPRKTLYKLSDFHFHK